jgi:putative tricarboxylic transport membrane protein
LDGYPLAQQGKADFALGLALSASSFGGVIASFAALLIIKPVASFALNFGPAETFLLALVGICVIVGISDKNPSMGLLAGAMGLLIATMPADPTLGRPRLNFGLLELYDSFPMIATMIGLFAFPSLIRLTEEEQVSKSDTKVGQWSEIKKGVITVLKKPVVLFRSTFIGLVVGILPGPGIDVGAFMSYSQAKIWSKHPETFGHGNPEGVIAAEVADNAVAAGAIVPTIALGIPGASTTAVMLAALTMHGVRPGPHFFRTSPNEVYALFIAVLLAQALLFVSGLGYTKLVSRFSTMNVAYVIPAVLTTCLLGTFATRSYMIDVWLFLIFGIIGYIMTENGYPYVPLVLGVVMGSLAEGYYIIATSISRGSLSIFFSSPISWVMWLVIIVVISIPIIAPKLRAAKVKSKA